MEECHEIQYQGFQVGKQLLVIASEETATSLLTHKDRIPPINCNEPGNGLL